MTRHDTEYVNEPIRPINTAHHGCTLAHPAVIETSPARIPLVKAKKSILTSLFSPVIIFLVQKVKRPEAAGARIVLQIALSASPFAPSERAAEDPALKNNQPSQRIRVPRTAC